MKPYDSIRRAEIQSDLAEIRVKQAEIDSRAATGSGKLLASEQRKYNALERDADKLQGELDQAAAMEGELERVPRSEPETRSFSRGNPLEVTPDYLDAVQHAFDTRASGLFNRETRAALTTTTYGAPREWAGNVLSAPRTLWEAAGIPREQAGAILASFPKLTRYRRWMPVSAKVRRSLSSPLQPVAQ